MFHVLRPDNRNHHAAAQTTLRCFTNKKCEECRTTPYCVFVWCSSRCIIIIMAWTSSCSFDHAVSVVCAACFQCVCACCAQHLPWLVVCYYCGVPPAHVIRRWHHPHILSIAYPQVAWFVHGGMLLVCVVLSLLLVLCVVFSC